MARGNAASLLTAAGAASAIGGAWKVAEFLHHAKKLKDVGPSNAVYVRVIARVRSDLDEVKRLLTVPEVHDALENNLPKAQWVYSVMRDVRGALENIAPHTERVASDIEDGRRVGLRHRVYWLMSEKEKLANREKEVTSAHASLMEVLGFLTGLEPVESKLKAEKEARERELALKHEAEMRKSKIEGDGRRGGVEKVVEREEWVERQDRGPRRVEIERETLIEHDRDPREQHRDIHVQHHHDPRQEEYYDDRRYAPAPGPGPEPQMEEHNLHIQRDPRDGHISAQYSERGTGGGPGFYDRYEARSGGMNGSLPRRPESFEDRVPDRETFMQSEARMRRANNQAYNNQGYAPSGYAEYGAPQPIGAASYSPRRTFTGDPGFGDQLLLNPAPVPPMSGPRRDENYEREVSSYNKYRGY